MSICCSRITKNALASAGFVDKEEPALSSQELNNRLQAESQLWAGGDRKEF